MITINLIDIIIITMIILIQEYICWMTYINWFKNTITYCKMIESYSFIGMMLLLPKKRRIIGWNEKGLSQAD